MIVLDASRPNNGPPFPRLRAQGEPLPELPVLDSDPRDGGRWHAEVDHLGRLWLAAGGLSPEPVRREVTRRRAIQITALALALITGTAWAQPPAPAPVKLGSVTVTGSIRTRGESWDWFSSGQGESAYTYSGTFARVSFSQARKRWDWQFELGAPILLGLPDGAVQAAPLGPLGLGGNYFSANDNRRNAAMVFLKQGNLRFKNLFGDERQSLKVGRLEFNDGTEVTPKDATLAALKRDRITQRLIGTFVWTHVQRSFDGFHYVANRKVSVHVLGALPTRGVFQVDGWGPLRTGFGYVSVNRAQGNSDWRLFGLYYHDWRNVLKTDNRPLAARRLDLGDIRIGTYGGHFLHAIPAKSAGTFDLLVWGAAQNGRWGVLDHAGLAVAAEVGWQPPVARRLKPWFRGGYYHGSGVGNAGDTRHGTFFQILPTPRPYARFPFFNMMNNEDVHGSVILRPSKKVTLKSEVHALRLSSGADQWLLGGGAFQPWSFGYIGRPSPVASGRPGLANLHDASVDWNANAHTTLSAYIGHAQGLRVVESIYTKSKHGSFGYVEFTYRF
jgi:hypothetical protein